MNKSEIQRKQIKGFPGYAIDANGSVWSCWKRVCRKGLRGSIAKVGDVWVKRKLWTHPEGYLLVGLSKNKKQITKRVNRLVLEAFVGECPRGMESCHNNGVRDDNRLENLRWDTTKNNQKDRKMHGTDNVGERHGLSKLTKEEVLSIRGQKRAGAKQIDLAKAYNVSAMTVSLVVNNKVWKHI